MYGAKRLTHVQQRRNVKFDKQPRKRKRTGAPITIAEFKRARATSFGAAIFGAQAAHTVFGVPAVDQATLFAISDSMQFPAQDVFVCRLSNERIVIVRFRCVPDI